MASQTFNVDSKRVTIPVKFINGSNSKSITLNVDVDTGAAITMIDSRFLTPLGLDNNRQGERVNIISADNSTDASYQHEILIQIGTLRPIQSLVVTGNLDGDRLLGWEKCLTEFIMTVTPTRVTFTEQPTNVKQNIKTIRKYNNVLRF